MLQIRIRNPHQVQTHDLPEGTLEFGRGPGQGIPRVQLKDGFVSRDQLRLECQRDGRVVLTNLSDKVGMKLAGSATIAPGKSEELTPPIRLSVGETEFEIDSKIMPDIVAAPAPNPTPPQSFNTILAPIQAGTAETTGPRKSLAEISDSPDMQTLASWFETLIDVQRAAANSTEFYDRTARALVELVGLDCGYVLELSSNEWSVLASHSANSNPPVQFSKTVLRHIQEQRRTFYQHADVQLASQTMSDVSAVVASPVFDGDRVVGAIYGIRSCHMTDCAQAIRPLEAHIVQVLAAAVGAGRARVNQEAEANRQQVLFEQFFSPRLVEALQRDPSLLTGRDREITVLFSDIRNFSGHSEKMDASQTCEFVGSVMSRLTKRVTESGGVVASYLGDGLLAMWNAPLEQEDHAERACRAALAMHQDLPALNEQWKHLLGADLHFGIGINTGLCMVGNTGSDYKFHYGPLGHTVNIASRVESTTKKLRTPILIAGTTQEKLGDKFLTRRLCQAHLAGMASPVILHELHSAPEESDEWNSRRNAYEKALALYENQSFVEASLTLFPLLGGAEEYYDTPTLLLAGRCIRYLQNPPETFDPAWNLQHK